MHVRAVWANHRRATHPSPHHSGRTADGCLSSLDSPMNEPYVVALQYKVEHTKSIDYSRAQPCDFRASEFDVRVEEDKVCFMMKAHFATEREARNCVESYILGWELNAALLLGPDCFKLCFDWADVQDRSPTPGIVSVSARPIRFSFHVSAAQGTVSPASYPPPPSRDLERSPDVESMLHRYIGYRKNREPLTSMANFCLTVLETAARGRRAIPNRFRIATPVLTRVATLCATKGGVAARKAKGLQTELTQPEQRFLEDAVKAMIRRVAEVAHDPNSPFQQITMSDFPYLGSTKIRGVKVADIDG